VVGVLAIGLSTGFGSELSAEPTAQAFLLDWQQGQYGAAGALTTASPGTVTTALKQAFTQVDATQLNLSMGKIVQHGGTAVASFNASVSLAGSENVWAYRGQFGLRRVNGNWKIDWAPSVINPSLGQGERLALVTKFPSRAPVLDAEGNPLQLSTTAYEVGVWPSRLSNPSVTASDFATATGLQENQVLGQITAAPPNQFVRLATLDPDTYASLRSGLKGVPGLVTKRVSDRLFQAEATGLVGGVGSEVDPKLRADGAFYVPGTTVGLSGLEQAYQRQLLGTPTTEVVAVSSAGTQTGVLASWAGLAGTPVHTTISSSVQGAALKALDGVPASGEIVAVQATTGQILAVAQHEGSGPLPAAGALNAQLVPGMAFSIVSAAALVSDGVKASTPSSCQNSFTVGGQTFTSDGKGQEKPFSAEFANGCSTALVGMSERLQNSNQFDQVVKALGIGEKWSQLPVPAFSGSVPSAVGSADLANEMIGQGNVRMSPLSMAMVAAAIDSGSWQAPKVVVNSASSPSAPGAVLSAADVAAVRNLMRTAVSSGAAHAANLSGAQVFGQVGLVHSGSSWTSWFVGYRGSIAFTVIETGKTAQLSAAALAHAFLSSVPS
jgi:cell division protein FtsI/penicillin-binding protein 2